jgi:outer membrane protein assembly factor BamB
VASPLCVDGLIYRMTQGGGLIVNDAATGELVYRKVLPMKPRTQYGDWAGAAASPTLAGHYIYLMDNQGTTVVIRPGRQYQEVAINVLEESKDGKSRVQNVSTPIFEGSRMYYRTPGYLYCIGEE